MSVIKWVLTRITIDTGLETRKWNFTNVVSSQAVGKVCDISVTVSFLHCESVPYKECH